MSDISHKPPLRSGLSVKKSSRISIKLFRKKRYLIIAAAVILLGGYFAWKARGSSDQVKYVTSTAQKGMIASSVSASGNVTVANSCNVTAQVSGTVANLAVKPGDTVKAGQVLFDIVNDQLDDNLSKSAASVAQAQSQVDSASSQSAQAQTQLDNDSGAAGAPATANITALQNQINAAQTQVNIAQNAYNASPTPDNLEKLQQAQASLSQAQANLTKARQQNQAASETAGSDSSKVSAANSAVSAAESNLTAAQADYQNQQETADKRTVTAPMNGTVMEVNVKNGDSVGGSTGSSSSSSSSGSSGSSSSDTSGASGAAGSAGASGGSGGSGGSGSGGSSVPIVIDDLGSMTATVQVSEVDITNVSIGQKAALTFDAIDGLSLTGKVTGIDSSGTVSSGVVNYNVTITLDTGDARLKPGMSVNAEITTAVKQNVLTVPSSAVKTEGSTQYVQVMVNGTPRDQIVTTGLSNDTSIEIDSGLKEGDTVVTQTINPNASSGSSGASGSTNFRGLGGGAGGALGSGASRALGGGSGGGMIYRGGG